MTDAPDLVPYVPRLALEWPEEAGAWRTLSGTLVFIDLSGFTSLSERLTTLGRAGAEEVTIAVDTTFASLLGVAYAEGANLLKFGGDALLLLFEGEGHELRGVRAAAAMRQRLRECGRIDTPAGSVRLGMSTGVHSGEILAVLAGTVHRELLVVGPAATAVAALEGAAGRGQIVIGASTAAALPASCVGAPTGPGYLLAARPRRAVAAAPPPRRATTGADGFVPAAIRAHLAAGGTEPEHRIVTLAFGRIGGIDDALVTDGPATVAAALDEIVSAVQEVAHAHDVAFLGSDIDGGGTTKLILAAGAPRASEDDEEHLLATVRAVADRSFSLPMRWGAHRGAVFAGDVGPHYRRTYTVMGDTVNTAARVMTHGAWGQVLATPALLAHARSRVLATPLPPFAAKGKSAPLAASEVHGLAPPVLGAGSRLPCVGRRAELEELRRSVRLREPVALVAPLGTGKTRVLEELVASEGHLRWTQVACIPGASERPWSVALQLAAGDRELLPRAGADDDASAIGRDAGQRERAEAVERFAQRISASVGTSAAVAVDDAQWCDQASLEVLLAVAARGVPVVLARRPGSTGAHDRFREVLLPPLPLGDAVKLVRHAASRSLVPEAARAIAERSAGYPLFVLELTRAVAAGADAKELPDSVERLIATRVDALEPRVRAALRRLSVLGHEAPAKLVAIVLDEPLDDHAWEALEEFVVRDASGTARFRLAVHHDVCYAGLPRRIRAALHARVAAELMASDPDDCASLAFHWSRAGDRARTWEYARRAAMDAWSCFGFSECAALMELAVRSGEQLADVDRVELGRAWSMLGQAARTSGDVQTARSAFARARNLLGGDPIALARIFLLEGLIADDAGRARSAVRWFRRGMAALAPLAAGDGSRDRLVARALMNRLEQAYGLTRLREGRTAEAEIVFRRSLLQSEEDGDLATIAHACNQLNMLLRPTQREEARRLGLRAADAFAALGHPRERAIALLNVAACATDGGDFGEAQQLLEQAAAATAKAADPLVEGAVHNNLADVLAARGLLAEAVERYEHARSAFTAIGHVFAALPTLELLRVRARTGGPRSEWERGLDALEERVAAMGAAYVPHLALVRVECLLFAADAASAQQALAALDAEAEPARARRLAGIASRDASLLDAAHAAAVATGNRYEELLALDALSALGHAVDRGRLEELVTQLGVVALPRYPAGADVTVDVTIDPLDTRPHAARR